MNRIASCGKVAHETRTDDARRAMRNQLRWCDGKGRDREPMGEYLCRACGKWHVGRTPKSER